MLVPAMTSTGTRSSSRTLRTPTCARPRAPPPLSARPIRGREDAGSRAGAAFPATTGGAFPGASRPRARSAATAAPQAIAARPSTIPAPAACRPRMRAMPPSTPPRSTPPGAGQLDRLAVAQHHDRRLVPRQRLLQVFPDLVEPVRPAQRNPAHRQDDVPAVEELVR